MASCIQNGLVQKNKSQNENTREPEKRRGCSRFKYTAVGSESSSRLQFDRFNFSDESLVVVS